MADMCCGAQCILYSGGRLPSDYQYQLSVVSVQSSPSGVGQVYIWSASQPGYDWLAMRQRPPTSAAALGDFIK